MKIKNTRDTLSNSYYDALKIRNQVFVKEQGISYTLEMNSPIQEAASIHFVLYDDNEKACGTCRLLTEENGSFVTLQRMAVLKEERSKGYAEQLMYAVLSFAKEHAIDMIILHSQLSARDFYTKFNFQEDGEIFEEAGIQHITMKIKL